MQAYWKDQQVATMMPSPFTGLSSVDDVIESEFDHCLLR
jgi:hypothetical protein